MTLLDLDDSRVGESPTRARCRCCRHKLEDPVSLAYGIGPDCRRKLGITPRQRVRLSRVKPGGDCEGQMALDECYDLSATEQVI